MVSVKRSSNLTEKVGVRQRQIIEEGNRMAKISDLKLAYQAFMKLYPYRSVDWRPGARLEKPLREARVAVVTTAAYFRPDQPPFDTSIRGGDYLYAKIPPGTDLSTQRIAHRSDGFDISRITSDK